MEETVKLFSKYRIPILVKKKEWENIKQNNKRKTKKEYIEELKVKNPTVEVIDEYINAKTKITHHCLVHDVYWEIAPTDALRGSGCKMCHKERIGLKNAKNHKKYIEELAIKNPHVQVIDNYINAYTKITHRCLIHDIYWKTTPNSALQGCGCEICHTEKLRDSKLKTHEQYVEELYLVNHDINVIEKYIGANTPILHLCKKHNIKWKATPSSILQGCGCKECGSEKLAIQNSKTTETYIEELALINPNIATIEEYKGANIPILHKCKIDNHEWMARPANILFGNGCPKCAGNMKKTHEEYIEELYLINPNITIVEEYITSITPILHKCLIDKYEWYAMPTATIRGTGCPKCAGNIKKTHDEYVKELSIINCDVKVIEQYVNAKTPILHKCLIDGCEWYVTPHNMLNKHSGCPVCRESSGERHVRQWLERNNIEYIYQKTFENCRDINLLPFDFYLPTYNLCVEYDDKQHFEPIEFFGGQEEYEYIVKHDNMKNKYCENNGISLLRIPYYKNIEEELNNFLFI